MMYSKFVVQFMILGFCLARPSPGGSSPLTPRSPQGGFAAAEWLPPLGESSNSTGNLYLPLNPGNYYESEQRFAFGAAPAGPFKGGELISSIDTRAYTSWKDIANAPIVYPQENP